MGSEKSRIWRTLAEKRRIVELTLQPGMSVARVAQAEGANSHQVFQWRRAYRDGGLVQAGERSTSLLPVVLSAVASTSLVDRQHEADHALAAPSGAIRIELPGRATISVASGADPAALRAVLESLRQ